MTMQSRCIDKSDNWAAFDVSDGGGATPPRLCYTPIARLLCVFLLILPSMVGVGLVILATLDGAGVSADSVFYLSVADEVADGNGLNIPWGSPEPKPLGTRWAPLLPWLLGAIKQMGPEPIVAVRYVNALAFGFTVLLFGYAVRRATRSKWPAFFGAMCLATSRHMLAIHEMAWSEPLFILFVFACLLLLSESLVRPRPLVVATVLACIGAALLTRFAGVAVPMAACAAFVFGAGRLRHRIAVPVVLCALLFVPMTSGGPLWIEWVINRISVGENAKFSASYLIGCLHDNLFVAASVFGSWLWPSRYCAEPPPPGVCIPLAFAAIALFGWMIARARFSPAFRDTSRADAPGARLRWMLGVFIVVYPLFLVCGQLLFSLNILAFDKRMLAPIFVPGLVLMILSAHAMLPNVRQWRRLRPAAVAACAVFLMARLPLAVERGAMLAHSSGAGAEGYHDAKWRTSPTMAFLASLPEKVPIYTNAPDAVYILAGRRACWLPTDWSLEHPDAIRDDGYTRPADLKEALSRGAVIAYFDRIAWRGSSPNLDSLRRKVPCDSVAMTGDGLILAAGRTDEAVAAGGPD